MKKIGKLFAVLGMLLVFLTGCGSSYERDTSTGEVINIRVAEMQEMIDNKESFAIVFTQTTCGHCIEFKEMLNTYLLDHNVVLYDVVLDEAPADERKSELNTIRETFPGMNQTPSLYYVKDGEMENQLENGEEGLTEERFDDWVQRYKLDEKK
ncbi:thioredoxin [Erysipelotrichaceae bacterium HCN-30851]